MQAARTEMIEDVRLLLAKAGFAVTQRCDVRPVSFDIVARRDSQLLIVKVLGNVDALNQRVGQELRTLARFLDGTPILVGERSSAGDLEDGVVYMHRGVGVLTIKTLQDYLIQDERPLAVASPGGLHVNLQGQVLRRLRQERALSLGLLAQVAGVSRRAIQMYEEGMRGTIDAALRLEEYLQASLVEPIDPFRMFAESLHGEPAPDAKSAERLLDALEQDIFRMLRTVGFRVVPTGQSPFNALSQEKKETILTGVDRGHALLERRAAILASITAVAEKDSMLVVDRELRMTNLRGTPLVNRKELRRVRDPDELVTLLDERRKPRPKE